MTSTAGSAGTAGPAVIEAFDYVWDRLRQRLVGTTDEEYFWEPVAGCWSLRSGADGRWVLDGGEGGGPAPDPAPFTTLAWRVGHVGGLAVAGFADRLFGPGSLTADDITFPGAAADIDGFLAQCFQPWRAGLTALSPGQWGEAVGTRFGPYAAATHLDLSLHVLDEVVHHGGEIGAVRDLYAHRASWTAAQ